jgi:hypothetical protein
MVALAGTAMAAAAGCGASASDSGFASDYAGGGTGGGATPAPGTSGGGSGGAFGGSASASSGGSSGGSSSSGSSSGSGTQVGPGILTAGVWDDNLNYDFFSSYLGAHPGIPGDPGFLTADYNAAHAASAQRVSHAAIDATLVIDTTGSMGDELQYLTAEFANIWGEIATKFPGVAQRWALVLYRDTPDTDPGDEYVVRSFDFMTSAQDFATTIGQQQANGGGDYPESPELGLEQLRQLTWRSDPSVAKMAFWVGDAPQHDYRGPQMKQAIQDVAAAGLHVYPVSASGTDDLLELTMRSAAELTGGRYMFLTDDSGVGDPHKIPEIPCYVVTKLGKALVRAASMELSGMYAPADPADVIRVEGSPTSDGKCTTADGQTVQIF